GIDVRPAMQIQVTASGGVNVDARRLVGVNGVRNDIGDPSHLPLPSAGLGALVAKIRYTNGRESGILAVGVTNTLTVDQGEYGRLLFGINDDRFDDNRGEFTVTMRW